MRITALAENTSSRPEIGAEHGLSLYIETAGRKILFDFGQTGLFAENALRLGIRLEEVELAVLSHGHYDHGGGLNRFLELNRQAPVYIHPLALLPIYFRAPRKEEYIGLDAELLRDNPRLRLTEGETHIAPGLTLYDCNDRPRPHALGSFGLKMKQDGVFLPDDFRHEQYLLIEEGQKQVLISGCSHKGILDIAQWFRPDYLIGGFHFVKLAPDERLAEYARFLGALPTRFYTCHCTGSQQYQFMQQYMPDLGYLAAGDTIII